jgi:hypothetical protein
MGGGEEPQQAALPPPSPAPPVAPVVEVDPVKEEPQRRRAKRSRSAIDSMKVATPLTISEELNDTIPW